MPGRLKHCCCYCCWWRKPQLLLRPCFRRNPHLVFENPGRGNKATKTFLLLCSASMGAELAQKYVSTPQPRGGGGGGGEECRLESCSRRKNVLRAGGGGVEKIVIEDWKCLSMSLTCLQPSILTFGEAPLPWLLRPPPFLLVTKEDFAVYFLNKQSVSSNNLSHIWATEVSSFRHSKDKITTTR